MNRATSRAQCPARKSHLGPAILALFCLLLAPATPAQQSPPRATLTVKTSAGATVWVGSLRFGKVPESGQLTVSNLRPGNHTVRARLNGKHEGTESVALSAGEERTVSISLSHPAEAAEQHFQNAEDLRDAGKQSEAIKEYRLAIAQRRTGYPAARMGLARSLMATGKHDDAVTQVRAGMRERGGSFPEAYTILGNLRRSEGLTGDAMDNYRTALSQSNDFSPEAHTGLALTYQDLGRPGDAIKQYKIAAAQAADTEPVIYYLLGSVLEREDRLVEAIEAYQRYVDLAPQGTNAGAIRSIIKQLKRELQ
jgi:tetratricopeptide (TPR) repeat protein